MRRTQILVALAVIAPVAIATAQGPPSPSSSGAAGTQWHARPEAIAQASKQQPGFNYDESRVEPYTLPDLLAYEGGKVTSPSIWREQRADILNLFRTNVYGRSPSHPEHVAFSVIEESPAAMDGAAMLRRIAITSRQGARTHRFELTLFLPNKPSGPRPVFLLINNRPQSNTDPTRKEKSGFWPAEQVIARGYGIAAFHYAELAPDDEKTYRDGVIKFFDDGTAASKSYTWGALAAWAWGASRAMDYFETDPRVDKAQVAVVGHSRGGKAALWAGAEDERFAMVVSNDSGEGGAALSRRNFGETIERITTSFPHWFVPTYGMRASDSEQPSRAERGVGAPASERVRGFGGTKSPDEKKTFNGRAAELPVDQHMLLALAAPRALYVASADEDLWADPRGEFLSLAASSPVFALWGDPPIRPDDMPPVDTPIVVGRRGYHIRTGGHNLTPYDWDRYMDFADRLWKR